MVEKYDSAAVRHYADATLLKEAGRLDNAGHLIGFAAECAIKYQVFTVCGGRPEYVHLPKLLSIARRALNGRNTSSGMLALLNQDIFDNWSVVHRYHATGLIKE